VTIKDSAESWVRSKPVLAMVAVGAVGLVVGGIVGLGVGYKVEKNRVQDDVQRIQQQLRDAGVTTSNQKVVQRVGEITAVSGSTLTVKTKLQGDQDIGTASASFQKPVDGEASDIAVGKRVLVAKGGREVIVLNDDAEIGGEVTRVTDDGFTVSFKQGRSADVKSSTVDTVYKLGTAESADAKVGAGVVIAGKATGTDGFQAVEVIVLPAGSAFNA
jgi:hypothetical protein